MPLTVVSGIPIPDGPGWRIRLAEVPDRTAADQLRGAYLEAEVADADRPGRDALWWHEVIGTPVVGLDGEPLGTVADVYRVAENDVYVVRGGGRGEFDLPAVRDFIRIFAPRRGEIVVDAAALALGPIRPPKAVRHPRPRKGGARPVATPAAAPAPPDDSPPPDASASPDGPGPVDG